MHGFSPLQAGVVPGEMLRDPFRAGHGLRLLHREQGDEPLLAPPPDDGAGRKAVSQRLPKAAASVVATSWLNCRSASRNPLALTSSRHNFPRTRTKLPLYLIALEELGQVVERGGVSSKSMRLCSMRISTRNWETIS